MPVSPYKQTIVRLRTDDHTALRTLAEKLDVPAAQLIRQAIREYLDSHATPNSNRAARLDRGGQFQTGGVIADARGVALPKPDVQPIFRGKDKL